MDGRRTLKEIVDAVLRDKVEKGLGILSPKPVGNLRGIQRTGACCRHQSPGGAFSANEGID